MAELLADRGEFLDVALEYFNIADLIPKMPGDGINRSYFFLTLAHIQIKRGESKKAIDTLTKVSHGFISPFNYLIYVRLPYLLGLAYEKEGRVDDAIEAYVRMASGLKTVSDKPHENLVALYQKRYGDLDGLVEMIESARLKARYKEYIEGRWLLDKAPQWTLQDTSGKSISLTDFANKIIVQCFVTTQYQSDVEELKYIQGLSDKYKDQGVVFICIDEGYPHPIHPSLGGPSL
jgi:tetratricopeptide (TPR) repeat protein